MAGEEREGSSIVAAAEGDCVVGFFGVVVTADGGGDEGEG